MPGAPIHRLTAVSVLLALCLAGCATEKHPKAQRAVDDYYFGYMDAARNRLRPYAAKTDEDYVLNNVRLGSAALADYDLAEAESAFFKAYEVLNSTGVNDAGRTSAAVIVAEKYKIWKGEPFERAMANFYLGLVYYMRQDYANARAAFENSLFKLRDYGEGELKEDKYREVESDFVIAYLMLARAQQRLGNDDKAERLFERVAELRSSLRPVVDRMKSGETNVLLVVDQGVGPRKVMRYDNSIVTFEPNPRDAGPLPQAGVFVNGAQINLRGSAVPPMDLLALGQDRRWQSIDTIRVAKSVVGTGLMAAGAYQGLKKDPEYGSAAALLVAGALLKASATGDVRHWEMLPRTTFVLPLRLSPGRHDVTVRFSDGSSGMIRGLEAPADGQETTYYLRALRAQRVVDLNPAPPSQPEPKRNKSDR